MISINTNLGSLIVQSNLKKSTNALNTAIERMTTGFKINGAKDNAANYSIVTDMDTQIRSLEVAEDNASMALDLLSTADSTLELVNSHLQRIRDLAVTASNGTYSKQSRDAVQAEIDARKAEIERIVENAEYNDIRLFDSIQTLADEAAGINLYSEIVAEIDTTFKDLGITSESFEIYDASGSRVGSFSINQNDTLQDFFDILQTNGLTASITDGVISIVSTNGGYIQGDLADELGISTNTRTIIQDTSYSSTLMIGQTVSTTADVSATLADLGISNSSFVIADKNNNAVKTVQVSSTETIGGLINTLAANSITASMTNGVLSLTSADNYTITGELAGILGITQKTETIESSYTQTLNLPISQAQPAMSGTTGVNTVTSGKFMKSVSRINTSGIKSVSDVLSVWDTNFYRTILEDPNATVKISTTEDLERLQNCSGTVECKLVLANNINASSIDDWEPLSIANSFDGNGYTISNLTSTQGAFLEVNERDDNTDIEIKNLGLVNINIDKTGDYTGTVGALFDIGYLQSDAATLVDNCFVTGSITTGDVYIGGITDTPNDDTKISNCYTDLSIQWTPVDEGNPFGDIENVHIGGIAGIINANRKVDISNCYSNARITMSAGQGIAQIGGIVGLVGFSSTAGLKNDIGEVNISNVRFTGTINTDNINAAGGIIGAYISKNTLTLSNAYFDGAFTGSKSDKAGTIAGVCPTPANVNISSVNSANSSNPLIYNWGVNQINLNSTLSDIGITNGDIMILNKNIKSGNDSFDIYDIYGSKTISEFFSELEAYDIKGTISNQNIIFSCEGDWYFDKDDTYIMNTASNAWVLISDHIINYSTIYSNTTSSNLSQNTTQTITNSSTLGSLDGYSNGNGEVVINKDGKVYATVTLSTTDTIADLISKLSNYGITGTLQNGLLSFEAPGNTTLDSANGGSNILDVLHIGSAQHTENILYNNSGSKYLSYSDNQGGSQSGGDTKPPEKPEYNGGIIFNVIGGNPDDFIQIDLSFDFVLDIDVSTDETARIGIENIDRALSAVQAKQTEIGAVENRFESVLEEISTKYENLVSSRTTLRDADIAEVSSEYICNQILQQASATLLATANQTPAIALQLL